MTRKSTDKPLAKPTKTTILEDNPIFVGHIDMIWTDSRLKPAYLSVQAFATTQEGVNLRGRSESNKRVAVFQALHKTFRNSGLSGDSNTMGIYQQRFWEILVGLIIDFNFDLEWNEVEELHNRDPETLHIRTYGKAERSVEVTFENTDYITQDEANAFLSAMFSMVLRENEDQATAFKEQVLALAKDHKMTRPYIKKVPVRGVKGEPAAARKKEPIKSKAYVVSEVRRVSTIVHDFERRRLDDMAMRVERTGDQLALLQNILDLVAGYDQLSIRPSLKVEIKQAAEKYQLAFFFDMVDASYNDTQKLTDLLEQGKSQSLDLKDNLEWCIKQIGERHATELEDLRTQQRLTSDWYNW